MSFECKECGESFDSERSLHAHFKKHNMVVGEYYTKHFPRFDRFSQMPLHFKTKEQYFNSEFNSSQNMIKWCDSAPKHEVKDYIIKEVKKELENKDLKRLPSSLYFKTSKLPDVDIIREVFGSFGTFAREVGVEPMYGGVLSSGFWGEVGDVEVVIDSREKDPLPFKKSKTKKLDFGDYTLLPSEYTYTHVERKSFEDFASSITNNYKRFLRELERCKSVDCFLFIVVETDITNISLFNNNSYKRFNMEYVFHKMRKIESKYFEHCQFIFSGSREYSLELIPKILLFGKKLWNVDVQYFWEKHLEKNGLDNRKPKNQYKTRGYTPKIKRKRGLFGRTRS